VIFLQLIEAVLSIIIILHRFCEKINSINQAIRCSSIYLDCPFYFFPFSLADHLHRNLTVKISNTHKRTPGGKDLQQCHYNVMCYVRMCFLMIGKQYRTSELLLYSILLSRARAFYSDILHLS